MGWQDDPVVKSGGWQNDPVVGQAEPMGGLDAALIGAGKQFTRLGQGIKGAYYSATGNDKGSADLAAQVAEENRLYKPLEDAHPIATMVGEAAPSLPFRPLGMALQGVTEYGTPEERAMRGGAGFVGGKVGEQAGKLLGRVMQPVRSATADASQALFDKFGMQALPGQIADSAPVRWATDALSKLPGGGRVRAIQEGQQQGLNRAALDTMGATGDAMTPEAVQAAKRTIGQTFEQVPAQATVQVDQKLATDLLSVEQNYYKNLSPDQRSIVKNYVDDILSHSNAGGMPGDVYQKARSRIAARAASTQDSELKTALGGVYRALDSAFDRSATPAMTEAMQVARSQWRAAKTLEPLANVEGNVSGARLANSAKGMPGDLGDLAKLGAKMRPLPSSGTAERLFYQSLLSGGAGGVSGIVDGDPTQAAKWAGGAFAAPWLASQMLTRAPVKNYLSKGLLNVTPEMERLLMSGGARGGGLLGLQWGQ